MAAFIPHLPWGLILLITTLRTTTLTGLALRLLQLQAYLILILLTIGGLLIGIFSDWYAFNDAGQGKAVVLFWTLYNVLVLTMTLITFVELPRIERHIADEPEKPFFISKKTLCP